MFSITIVYFVIYIELFTASYIPNNKNNDKENNIAKNLLEEAISTLDSSSINQNIPIIKGESKDGILLAKKNEILRYHKQKALSSMLKNKSELPEVNLDRDFDTENIDNHEKKNVTGIKTPSGIIRDSESQISNMSTFKSLDGDLNSINQKDIIQKEYLTENDSGNNSNLTENYNIGKEISTQNIFNEKHNLNENQTIGKDVTTQNEKSSSSENKNNEKDVSRTNPSSKKSTLDEKQTGKNISMQAPDEKSSIKDSEKEISNSKIENSYSKTSTVNKITSEIEQMNVLPDSESLPEKNQVTNSLMNPSMTDSNQKVVMATGNIFLAQPSMDPIESLAKKRYLDELALFNGDSRTPHAIGVIEGRCDVYKLCPDTEYCDGMFCYKCKSVGDHCDLNGECCTGSECQYGYCASGVQAGHPGTFCDLSKDCKGEDVCCIHEISVSQIHSICKPMLSEHESCGPINLFHQDVMKANLEPICGPCKKGLSCKGVGILGRHSICLPDDEE